MDEPPNSVAMAILAAVSSIPHTTEPRSPDPRTRARTIQKVAGLKAASVAGTLALPPGPYGLLTIIPDLLLVWRIQTQMVADIAGAFGKSSYLKQEQMLYCLFRHAAAQVVRDLLARVGERVVFRRATLRVLQEIAKRLGMKVTQRLIAKTAARWVPIIGALGVAGYAYYDTTQVGKTAMDLFEKDFGIDEDEPNEREPVQPTV